MEGGRTGRVDAAADIPAEPERHPRAAAREARAERYFKRDLEDQRRWHGDRAPTTRVPSLPSTVGRGEAGADAERVRGRP